MVVKLSMLVFWVITPCGLVGCYHHFREIYALKVETVCFSKMLVSVYEST
jgi:hypothetical protein